jgi:hypothetical protein
VKFVYLACPVRPIEGETKEGNLALAREIYRKLCLEHRDVVFLMPWLLNCEVFDETPEMIELGMERNFAVIAFLGRVQQLAGHVKDFDYQAEIWLRGPRVSSGMQMEADYAARHGLSVHIREGSE